MNNSNRKAARPDFFVQLEKRTRAMVESLLNENEQGFCPMRGYQYKIFFMRQLIKKFHKGKNNSHVCFLDLHKNE